jgi:hypothetical protein
MGPSLTCSVAAAIAARDPRIGDVPDRLTPAELIPHEDPVPTPLLRVGGQTRDHARVGKLLEQRQP